jgi:serine/threonine protein kinase
MIKLLGKGGMGEVYHVEDRRLDRNVIKILPEMASFNSEAISHFQREAKTLAALSHPKYPWQFST